MDSFADWLNQERLRRNLSLRGLARLAGVSPPTTMMAAVMARAVLQPMARWTSTGARQSWYRRLSLGLVAPSTTVWGL